MMDMSTDQAEAASRPVYTISSESGDDGARSGFSPSDSTSPPMPSTSPTMPSSPSPRHHSSVELSYNSSYRMPQDVATFLTRRGSQRGMDGSFSAVSTSLSDQHEEPPLKSLTKTQIFTLIAICFTWICATSFYSLLAPFFATEAAKKGASPTEVGFVFGIFQGIMLIMSPIYGKYMVVIGPKFMFITGSFVTSCCAILFGTLEWCPAGRVYIAMCFLVRSLEALAAAATNTASLAIAANTFPDSLSKVMGLIELCSSLGLMLGPPLGGVLFSAGGFHLPFFVTGSFMLVAGTVAWFVMPTQEAASKSSSHGSTSFFDIIRLPVVLIVGYMVFIGQTSIGFFDVGMAQHLSRFVTSKAIIGVIFLAPICAVVVLAPLNGFLVDKNRMLGRVIIIVGASFGCIGVLGLGPSPVFPYLPDDQLWVPVVSLAVSGLGLSCLVVTYQEFVGAAVDAGIVIDMETQGMIAGTYNSFNSLGHLVGPTLGGILIERLNFPNTCTIFGFGIALAAVMLAAHSVVTMATWPCLTRRDDQKALVINSQPV